MMKSATALKLASVLLWLPLAAAAGKTHLHKYKLPPKLSTRRLNICPPRARTRAAPPAATAFARAC